MPRAGPGITATRPGVPAQANGRPAGFIGYIWRDPARVGPDRLAELAARDEHLASLRDTGPEMPANVADKVARSAELRALFAAARETGASVLNSATAAGVCRRTGQLYERDRRDDARTRDVPASCTCRWSWDGRAGSWKRAGPTPPDCPWHSSQKEAAAQ